MHRRLTLGLVVVAAIALIGCAVPQQQVLPTPGRTAPTNPAATSSAPLAPTPSVAATTKTTSATPAPVQAALLFQQGQAKTQVRELQARLRQLGLYQSYDVIDTFGPRTTAAVTSFQTTNKLKATGAVDDATWAALLKQTLAPAAAQLNNQEPGANVMATVEQIKDLQLRLNQITGYAGGMTGAIGPATKAAVKEFQTQQGIPATGVVDQRTWDHLTWTTRAPTPWELAGQPAPPAAGAGVDPRCLSGKVICVSMTALKVWYVVDGKILLALDARFGWKEHPTFPGDFRVYAKDAKAVSTLFPKPDGSPWPMPWAMYFDNGRAVHYSADFLRDGYLGTSHGCVNTRDLTGVKWLFSQVNIGDRVIVYK